MQHILRSVQFIAKAANNGILDSMSPEDQKKVSEAAENAKRAVAESVVPAGKMELFDRLMTAVKKDESSLKQDSKGAITKTLKVVEEDILNDSEDASTAETKIKDIEANGINPEPSQSEDDPEDVAANIGDAFKMGATVLDQDILDQEVEDDGQEVEDDELPATNSDELPDEDMENTTASLLQVRARDTGEQIVKYVGFVGLSILLVLSILYIGGAVMGAIITWIAASLLGCTAYLAGRYSVKDSAAIADISRMNVPVKWGSCVAGWVSAPFRWVYKAIKWVVTTVRGNPDKSLLEMSTQQVVVSDTQTFDKRGPNDWFWKGNYNKWEDLVTARSYGKFVTAMSILCGRNNHKELGDGGKGLCVVWPSYAGDAVKFWKAVGDLPSAIKVFSKFPPVTDR
jgi:hypothetical protein